MEKDLMNELGKAMNDAISSVLKETNIPSAVLQAKITIDGGSDWMTFGGAISGTEHVRCGGGGGKSSGVSASSGGNAD